ncbi:UNVERIFIED_CONTAM: hypothetical protein FKN15_039946 [Acipenser sinensis]
MDRNALAELLQALESRRDAEERRREERYTALIERHQTAKNHRSGAVALGEHEPDQPSPIVTPFRVLTTTTTAPTQDG